jgi:hypothetical protein
MDDTPTPWAPPTVSTPAADTSPAAPSAPAAPPPMPPMPAMPAPESVVLIEPPIRRRSALLLVAALVVLAGLGAGAFFILRGDNTPTYALDRAANAAEATHWSEAKITMETGGQSITMNAQTDTTKGLAKMSMDLGAISGSSAPIDMIIDIKNDTMYMGSAFLTALGANVNAKWVKIDRASLEKAGQDASAFDQLDVGNQLAPAALFASATDVKKIGVETIDGEQLQHDQVTVDTAKVVALNPFLARSAKQSGATLPPTITYDVYITKDNQIRQLAYDFSAGGASVKVTVVTHALAAAPPIEVPADSDVADLGSLG